MTKARTLGNLASAGGLDNFGTVKSIVAGTGLTGGTITTTGTINLANTTVTAGSYTAANITVDAQGRITSATSGTAVSAASATSLGTLYGTENIAAYSNSIGYGSAPGSYSVSMGYSSISSGANFSLSAGYNSSVDSGSGYSVALGSNAKVRSGGNSVVIGAGSSIASGGSSHNMVLIGQGIVAGYYSYNSIVIGQNARLANYAPNTIVLEATGSTTNYSSGFYVNPVTQGSTSYGLYYNPTTKKITYDVMSSGSSLAVLDQGNTLISAATSINFTGDNVTATSNGSAITVDVTSGNLDGLTDVTITAPTTGQVLQYNGTAWVNATVSTGGSSGGGGTTEAAVTVETPSPFNGQFTLQPNTTGSRGYVYVNCWDGYLNYISSNSPINWISLSGSQNWFHSSQPTYPSVGLSISWDPMWYGNFTAIKIQGVDGGGAGTPNLHGSYQTMVYSYFSATGLPNQSYWAQNYNMYAGAVSAYAVVLASSGSQLANWFNTVLVSGPYTDQADVIKGSTGAIGALGGTSFDYMVLRVKPAAFNNGGLGSQPIFTFQNPPNDIPLNWIVAGKQ